MQACAFQEKEGQREAGMPDAIVSPIRSLIFQLVLGLILKISDKDIGTRPYQVFVVLLLFVDHSHLQESVISESVYLLTDYYSVYATNPCFPEVCFTIVLLLFLISRCHKPLCWRSRKCCRSSDHRQPRRNSSNLDTRYAFVRFRFLRSSIVGR